VLLPEPPSQDPTWKPEASAAEGMPIFLKALYERGAKKERLEACIAGGALIDPVSRTDLVLDIGGRTANAVGHILRNENIPVLKSEIGGYFSWSISLNLMTWETSVDLYPIPKASAIPVRDFKPPTLEDLDRVIQHLLPIPQVALKIMRMVDDENCSFKELGHEVIQDQVLSAKIIGACNAAAVNSGRKIDSIDKALLRLGEKNLLLLALSLSVQDLLSNDRRGYSLCKGGLFRHSLITATISSNLAEISGKAHTALAYTVGLLHDIGKIVLDQYMYDAYPLFYREIQGGGDLISAEKALFRIAHTEAGHKLAVCWSMPTSIGETVLYHHDPEKSHQEKTLTHIVYLADLLSSRFMQGLDVEKMDTTHLRASLDILQVDLKSLPALFHSIESAMLASECTIQ
jgi:putative nucleotidyltransferase with HDIG domain